MFKSIQASKSKVTLLLLLILVTVFFAFRPSLKNGFTNWDDDKYVTENPAIQSLSLPNLRKIFTSFFVAHYQPVTILSYAIEYRLYKLNPFGYHLTNLFLHLLNCLLVFWLIFIFTGKFSISWVTAILFSVHPLQVESVAWISERKNLLYAFFFLGALISYLYYLVKRKELKYYFFCLFLFILSLLSKSMAVTLPLVMFLMDYLFCRKVNKDMFFEKIPFFVLALIFGIVAIFGASLSGQKIPYSLLSIFIIAPYCIVFYLNKILLPVNFSCFYPYDNMQNLAVYLYAAVLVVILAALIIISGRYTRKVIFGSAFFLFSVLPVLQSVSNGKIIVADRYVYVSIIGIFYILAEGLIWLCKKRGRPNSVGIIIFIVCLVIFFFLVNF